MTKRITYRYEVRERWLPDSELYDKSGKWRKSLWSYGDIKSAEGELKRTKEKNKKYKIEFAIFKTQEIVTITRAITERIK